MRQNSCAIGRFEGMLTEPDTMGVVSKAEDGCIRSDWPPRLLVAVGCPGGVGSRGFQKKRDLPPCPPEPVVPLFAFFRLPSRAPVPSTVLLASTHHCSLAPLATG